MIERQSKAQSFTLPAFRNGFGDFRPTLIGCLCYLVALVAALALADSTQTVSRQGILAFMGSGLAVAFLLFIVPFWGSVLVGIAALFFGSKEALEGSSFILPWLVSSAGLLVFPMLQLAQHWEKALVFRLGRLKNLRGPGPFIILPLVDRAVRRIDTRIRVVEFTHEKTLTKDTVPVSVDAIAYWMVWDAEKATLEVEDYLEAVTLSAHAALRNAIGKHELSSLLSEQERLGKEIQEYIDEKTNPWGISILSIGITEIAIAKELEDSLSKEAQARREQQSRQILAEAEAAVADSFVSASRKYADNPTALQLRGMNIAYEGLRKNGTILLLPSGAVQEMALGTAIREAIAKNGASDSGLAGDSAGGGESSTPPGMNPGSQSQGG